MTWREKYIPIIAAVLAEHAGKSLMEKRVALRNAFPHGPRENHPYKIWLDECRVQLGTKPIKPQRVHLVKPQSPPAPGQRELF